MLAEHIALYIADELEKKGLDASSRWASLLQAGLLMEVEMKGEDTQQEAVFSAIWSLLFISIYNYDN